MKGCPFGWIKILLAKIVIGKIITTVARDVARKARESVKERCFGAYRLPGKLRLSNSKQEGTELFIVEGLSGWFSQTGKKQNFKVFIRGKILNTFTDQNGKNGKLQDYRTKSLSKMMSSNEIVTLINALGLDPKAEEIDIKDLRYGKIIIMTDADVDGSHIRALLLTFFNNKPFHKLIENGNIYLLNHLYLK